MLQVEDRGASRYSRRVESQRLRVLVVEDDPGIRQMVVLALRSAGHEVRTSDGRGEVEAGDADVVLLDVRLGNRTAHELLAANPALASRELILMTASARPREAAVGLPEPIAILSKPFDLSALDEALAGAASELQKRSVPLLAERGLPTA